MLRLVHNDYGQLSATVAAVGSLDVRRFSAIAFNVSGLTLETLTVQCSFDGGQTWSSSNLAVYPIAGGAAVTTIPSAAAGYMSNDGQFPPCTHIRFTKSAAAETVTIKYCLRQA